MARRRLLIYFFVIRSVRYPYQAAGLSNVGELTKRTRSPRSYRGARLMLWMRKGGDFSNV